MTEEELNERIEILEKKKAAFTRNRNLCALGTAFLGYNFYTTISRETPPVWFLLIMGAIILACAGIGLYGHKTIKGIDLELAELYKEQQALNQIEEESDDDE